MSSHGFVLQSDWYHQIQVPEVNSFPANVTRLSPPPFLSREPGTEANTDHDICPPSFMQLDYFHPSLVAHQQMAKSLWNSMLTPAARKKTYIDFTEPIVCPESTTRLYTN